MTRRATGAPNRHPRNPPPHLRFPDVTQHQPTSIAACDRRTRLRTGAVLLTVAALLGAVSAVNAQTVTFRNDVMAVLSKAGCNAGTCHGNAFGKGGFRLSLRGDDPDADYQAIVRHLTGRRINLADPDRSLLLAKASLQIGHGGGLRFRNDSAHYAVIRQWIANGAPLEEFDAVPHLVDLVVTPEEHIALLPDAAVQLQATAVFSDGSRRYVTSQAVFEPSSQVVTVTENGLATAERVTEATIAVRFLDIQKPARLAFVAPRRGFEWNPPPVTGDMDRIVFDRLHALQIHPSELCDDATFLRRAYLDLTGCIPTADESRVFIADTDPGKRRRLVDELLERPEFAEFWALKWSDLLRNEERTLDRKGVANLHGWIRNALADNVPLDEFARKLLTARGSTYANPAANYYRALRTADARSEAAAQVFLGLRLQCAKCHNHPFDRWTQNDYYSWGSVFAQVDYKVLENNRIDSNDKHEFDGEQIVFCREDSVFKDPRTGRARAPQLLAAAKSLPDNDDRLIAVADWITSPDNPWFARTQANRIYSHLLGRGLVDPVDDVRITNPAVYPELLDWLAADLIEHEFDQRHTIRTIMNSSLYQLSSEPNDTNRGDETHFARAAVRRLTAEQLLDSIMQATGADVTFNGYPVGTRARQVAGVAALHPRRHKPGPADRFLTQFGKPRREQSCDCERSDESTLAQTFELISGPLMDDLLTNPDNRIGRLLQTDRTDSAVVDELYWTTLSRPPAEAEQTAAVQHLASTNDRRAACEDLLWSLINSAEFLLRR